MDLIEKLENWVQSHPEEAQLPTMNVSTGRTFTVQDVLDELKREKETGVAIVDEELLEVKSHVESWLKEV